MPKLFGKLCLYGFGRTPNLIVVIAPIVRQLLIVELSGKFLAPAVTVGETEGAMDSASVLFTSFFAYNFARK